MSTRQQQSIRWSVLIPALLAAVYSAGVCEARPWSYDYEREIPTATAAPAPDTVKLNVKPTPFRFRQSFVDRKLMKRVEYPETVCGFIGGDVGLPATCSQGSTCIWDTAHRVIGCLPTAGVGTTAVYTACEDDDDDEDQNPWALHCTGNDECYRNTYEAISGNRFYQFGCGQSEWATTVLTQPISVRDQSARVVLTSINMGNTPTESSSSSSSTSSSESSTSPPSSVTSSSEPPTTSGDPPPPSSLTSNGPTTNDPGSPTSGIPQTTSSGGSEPSDTTGGSSPIPNQGSGTDTGAIIGGVVGGVAGLALLGALLFFLKKRRNREQNKRISEASLTSSGPHDMGSEFEPKELDATSPEIRSELPGDSILPGPLKAPEPVELPGSEPVGPGYHVGETKGVDTGLNSGKTA